MIPLNKDTERFSIKMSKRIDITWTGKKKYVHIDNLYMPLIPDESGQWKGYQRIYRIHKNGRYNISFEISTFFLNGICRYTFSFRKKRDKRWISLLTYPDGWLYTSFDPNDGWIPILCNSEDIECINRVDTEKTYISFSYDIH